MNRNVTRLLISVTIGSLAAFYGHAGLSVVRPGDDFLWYWLGGRALVEGRDPYSAVSVGGAYHLDAPFVYPLTTAMIAAPFSFLSPVWAGTLFIGLSAALLAWAITKHDYVRLPIFGSAPFVWASHSGQLSPLITASALMPALAWLATVKPNLGLATVAYRPTRWTWIGSLAFVGASLLINPGWPAEWWAALHSGTAASYGKGIPLTLSGGPLLLLALTRWRRPEARLFLVMVCVPQTLMFYDQLPLWLIARTRLQSASLGLVSLVGLLIANQALPLSVTHAQAATIYWPMIYATCYLPTLAMIMREKNVV